jgi:hypothetical protein
MIGSVTKHSKRPCISSVPYELIIEEICDPPKSYPYGNSNRNLISNKEERSTCAIHKIHESEYYSDNSPMKAHPSFIDSKYLEWLFEVVRKIVEYNISKSSSENNSSDYAISEEVKICRRKYLTILNPEICPEYTKRISKTIIGRGNRHAENLELKYTH